MGSSESCSFSRPTWACGRWGRDRDLISLPEHPATGWAEIPDGQLMQLADLFAAPLSSAGPSCRVAKSQSQLGGGDTSLGCQVCRIWLEHMDSFRDLQKMPPVFDSQRQSVVVKTMGGWSLTKDISQHPVRMFHHMIKPLPERKNCPDPVLSTQSEDIMQYRCFVCTPLRCRLDVLNHSLGGGPGAWALPALPVLAGQGFPPTFPLAR